MYWINTKCDFWVKFCQNLTFDLSTWGQISLNFKKAFTCLFLGSRRLSVQISVYIGLTRSERQRKTWFWCQIMSKFDLWPLHKGPNFIKFQKRLHTLVFIVKVPVRANFCQHQTNKIWTTTKNVILGSNFVKIWPLTSTYEVNSAKFQKGLCRRVYRVK